MDNNKLRRGRLKHCGSQPNYMVFTDMDAITLPFLPPPLSVIISSLDA